MSLVDLFQHQQLFSIDHWYPLDLSLPVGYELHAPILPLPLLHPIG